MKKLIIIVIVFTVQLNSQQVWNIQNAGTIASFTKIQMFDSLNGIMTGYNNALYNTTNGGMNWTGSSFISNLDYYNMQFVNSNTGYIMAIYDFNNYQFLKTTNRGINWNQLFISGLGLIRAFYYYNENNGWAGNDIGDIFYSQDGGNNWNNISLVGYSISAIYFKNLSVGFTATGSQNIFSTDNAGYNWVLRYSGGSGAIYDMFFLNDNTGFACGSTGRIAKTTNGGMSWESMQTNCIFILKSVKFINENTGYAVGAYGTILYTTNGGSTWQRYQNVTNLFYHSLQIINNKAWICGEFGIILKCENILDN